MIMLSIIVALQQIQIPEQPQDIDALLWIVVSVLAFVVAYLYRAREKDRDKMYDAITQTSAAMNSLVDTIESYQRQTDLLSEVRQLREEVKNASSGEKD